MSHFYAVSAKNNYCRALVAPSNLPENGETFASV